MASESGAQETVVFRRRAELPGVEVRDVEGSARHWRCFSLGYEFLTPTTWQGDIVYRRHQERLSPGDVFCSYPGEVFSTPRVYRAGGGSALVVEPEVLDQALREHGMSLSRVQFRRVSKMSNQLATKLGDVFRLLNPGTSALELQSALSLFLGTAVRELSEVLPAAETSVDAAGVERVREQLHFDPLARTDLAALSEQSGLSRFQVLRAFKRVYGLPPHAYQLRVRIGLAQRALRAGRRPAEVAEDFGFVDQSHFSRHFKQLVGVTPLQYMTLEPTKKSGSASRAR
ncbi:MAG: helix-turn-helix domain-containing protein [Myxococcota bacterium]